MERRRERGGGGTKGIREGRNERGKKYEKVYMIREAEKGEQYMERWRGEG